MINFCSYLRYFNIFSNNFFDIILRIKRGDKKKVFVAEAIFSSKSVLFGLPIAISFIGEEKAGSTSMLIACIIPTFNFLTM